MLLGGESPGPGRCRGGAAGRACRLLARPVHSLRRADTPRAAPGAGIREPREAVLPDLDEVDAVELGCGGGQGTVGLAREGADAVGVDFSTAQLAHARRLRDAYGVDAQFLAGDVTALPLAESAFDLAYCPWVFQMVDDLDSAFAEARRVLRAGGAFVFAVPHPFYETFDPEACELDRSYFERGPKRESIGDYDPDLLVFHHRVADYHQALVDSGFTVERLLEPGSPDPDDYEEQWSHKPELMAKVPPALVVRAVAE